MFKVYRILVDYLKCKININIKLFSQGFKNNSYKNISNYPLEAKY